MNSNSNGVLSDRLPTAYAELRRQFDELAEAGAERPATSLQASTMRLCAETGHVSEAVADALADGVLEPHEVARIERELAHAAEVIASAQRSLRRT